ncbi:Peptidase S24/S26A/S26B, conserved region [Pseudodesulfovibrio mercurii]|uniref:Peptidase S24/S26A/S26B, conserved region n=1 Tax=Pseudodesulfovibrio mercurii TaxID=641491 RepID=F0JIS8_9BACT|nr:translesion error-prone DNA polymerase V autoproteolytic subunit [Pseudodesulfovibrio mercurii]EGB15827.1 Peptidase S24/S26A/S26B, conserved region [Pseudodesulfovibrio mercurii]
MAFCLHGAVGADGRAWAICRPCFGTRLAVPLAGESVPAGFPSPAEEYLEKRLDLNEHLVTRPEATYFVRVSGDSMIGAGIHHGDLLVVDRSLDPRPGNVVIALVEGEFTVKRLRKSPLGLELAPENPEYVAILLSEETDFLIWGVVLHVIHTI